MIFNVTSGGGGTKLNFEVIASTTQPSAPKQNTIWANTAVAVTKVAIRRNTPAAEAGLLWIQTSDAAAATVGIAAISTNKLVIAPYLLSVYVYTGSAWASVPAKVYLGSAWVAISALPVQGTALNSCSWAQIAAVGAAGLAGTYFQIGNTKNIMLNTGEAITLQIIGFNHDNLTAGGKAPITFCFMDCMQATKPMNGGNTNVGGYSGCELYSTINNAIYQSLPSDLRAVMKNVTKLTSAGNQSNSIVTTQEKLFLLSEVEIFGSIANSKAGEGTQYAFFTNGGTRVKRVAGTATQWWERSPDARATSFGTAGVDGAAGYGSASHLRGVVLGLSA